MTTITTLSARTTGQARSDDDIIFNWTLTVEPSSGARWLSVQRHGGNTLRWSEGAPMPAGPADTRLIAYQIAQEISFNADRRSRRFLAVGTHDLSSGTRRFEVLDTAASRPQLARVCSAPEEWAEVIAKTLEVADPSPDDLPF